MFEENDTKYTFHPCYFNIPHFRFPEFYINLCLVDGTKTKAARGIVKTNKETATLLNQLSGVLLYTAEKGLTVGYCLSPLWAWALHFQSFFFFLLPLLLIFLFLKNTINLFILWIYIQKYFFLSVLQNI